MTFIYRNQEMAILGTRVKISHASRRLDKGFLKDALKNLRQANRRLADTVRLNYGMETSTTTDDLGPADSAQG